MKNNLLKLISAILIVIIFILLIYTIANIPQRNKTDIETDTEETAIDTNYLEDSDIDVDFSDLLISNHDETRKLMISTQEATVSTELTDRIIQLLDFNFLKKSQTVHYTGTGYFVVDLNSLTGDNIIQDNRNRTITIQIEHPHLESIEINPNNIIIEEVQESLFARGSIKLTVQDYTTIEQDLRSKMQQAFETPKNIKEADKIALSKVREVYEPIVTALDSRYHLEIEFK